MNNWKQKYDDVEGVQTSNNRKNIAIALGVLGLGAVAVYGISKFL